MVVGAEGQAGVGLFTIIVEPAREPSASGFSLFVVDSSEKRLPHQAVDGAEDDTLWRKTGLSANTSVAYDKNRRRMKSEEFCNECKPKILSDKHCAMFYLTAFFFLSGEQITASRIFDSVKHGIIS